MKRKRGRERELFHYWKYYSPFNQNVYCILRKDNICCYVFHLLFLPLHNIFLITRFILSLTQTWLIWLWWWWGAGGKGLKYSCRGLMNSYYAWDAMANKQELAIKKMREREREELYSECSAKYSRSDSRWASSLV